MRVLICDSDALECAELEEGLRADGREWDVTVATDADQALAVLERGEVDVVLADVWLADADGTGLLERAKQVCPRALRVGLAAHSDRRGTLRCAGSAQQVLAKPCDPADAVHTIERSHATREILRCDEVRDVISQVDKLPSAPALYGTLVAEIQSPEPSVARVAEIISSDPAMTAKVLQLVNSAFFGFRWRVTAIQEAVALIGLRMVKDLVLSIQVFSRYDGLELGAFNIDALVGHSLAVGNFAKIIALAEGADRTAVGDAFLGGILHDVGKLLLADRLPKRYGAVLEQARLRGTPLWRAEAEELGTTHAEVGAYLLALWGLSDAIVEAVAFHHRPERSATMHFAPLTAVHVGNLLAHDSVARTEDRLARAPVSAEFLGRQDLMGRVQVWQFNCEQVAHDGE